MSTLLVFCKIEIVQKSTKLWNMVKIEDEKSSHILLGLMNFNEIFGKNVTHDNLKGTKNKLLSSLFLQDTFLEN